MGHYDDCYDDYNHKPKIWRTETSSQINITPKTKVNLPKIDGEEQRLRDALCTIGSLLTKYTKTRPVDAVNVSIALDIIDGALDGTWPAYGVIPKQAAEYLEERQTENDTKKKL